MKNTTLRNNEEPNSLDEEVLRFEKYKFHWSLVKWAVVSVVMVMVAILIEGGIKERSIGIQEMQAFDKYIQVILKTNNIEERLKLAEYFSVITPTQRLRDRWIAYRNMLKSELGKYKMLKQVNKEENEVVIIICNCQGIDSALMYVTFLTIHNGKKS